MAGFFSIEIEDSGVNAQLAAIRGRAGANAQRIVVAMGYEVLAEEQELEPVDLGNLRGSTVLVQESGTVTSEIKKPDGQSYTVSGPVEVGPSEVAIVAGADYAAEVNANEDAEHEVGQAHFAETALQNIGQRQLPERLATGLLSGGS